MLSLAGEWIVGAGPQLEAAGASSTSLAKDAKRVILDLAGLERMDTAGAWSSIAPRTNSRAQGLRSPTAASSPSTISCSRRPATIRPRSPRWFIRRTQSRCYRRSARQSTKNSGIDCFDVELFGEVVAMFLRLAPHPWPWR